MSERSPHAARLFDAARRSNLRSWRLLNVRIRTGWLRVVSADAARAHPFGDRGDGLPPGTGGRLADGGPTRAFRGAGAATAPSATSAPTSTAPASAASASAASSAPTASASAAATASSAATTASTPAAAYASAASAGAATATAVALSIAAARADGHRDGAWRYDGQCLDEPNGRLVIAHRRQSAGEWISRRHFRNDLGRPGSAGLRLERRRRDCRAVHSCLRLPARAQAL